MKPPLIAFLLIATISSCKKEYSYEGGPSPTIIKKPLCMGIMGKWLYPGDTTGHFMLDDGAMGYGAELIVSRATYDSFKQGAVYCNIPMCGYLRQKYISPTNHPIFTYGDFPNYSKMFSVTLPVTQAEYDKYNPGDPYCRAQ